MGREKPVTNAIATTTGPVFTHRWRLMRILPHLYGKLCRIVPDAPVPGPAQRFGWGEKKLTLEFADGTVVKASRMAVVAAGKPHVSRVCSQPGCGKPHRAHGLCATHNDAAAPKRSRTKRY